MKVAVIGTGIAGMTAARELHAHGRFDLTIYERNDRIGGHTHTVNVPLSDGTVVPVDTGFMVYNRTTYPGLIKLFEDLAVPSKETCMSFSFQNPETGIEYSGDGFNGYFAQRSRLADPKHWIMLGEIFRFGSRALERLTRSAEEISPNLETLGDFLENERFSQAFRNRYILPMVSAIWSTPPGQMLEFPAVTLFHFMNNHGLLRLRDRLQWLTIDGGSQVYRDRLIAPFRDRIRAGSPVLGIARDTTAGKVTVTAQRGGRETYDAVVIAAHASQALSMLCDPTRDESAILGAFSYSRSYVKLHSDPSPMPVNRRAWASWNFRHQPGTDQRRTSNATTVTYWMNRLQGLPKNIPLFVTLNDKGLVADETVHWEGAYAHPVFDQKSINAQRQLHKLFPGERDGKVGDQATSRETNTFYCGSYMRYGFHEDAHQSGLRAARALIRQASHMRWPNESQDNLNLMHFPKHNGHGSKQATA